MPVADQLALAMDNFPTEEGNEKLAEFKDGIKMTQDELSRALEKNNIVLGKKRNYTDLIITNYTF